MSDLITRTARLVPYGKRPKQVPSYVTAYAYEPLADDPGSALGNLYVVVEVLVSGRGSEELADLLIETVGDQYYNRTHEQGDPLSRFEAAIKAVNAELTEHVNRGNAAWIGKLSAIIAMQAGTELHIAGTGSAEGTLYRGKSSTRMSTTPPSRPSTPSKTFGSIASGEIEPGDRMLLATPALTHQIPLAKLQSIIGQSGPNAAIAEITHLLKGASVDRIAALVIEITTPELAALQVRSEQPSEIHLGTPDNAMDAVKLVTEPIAQGTLASGKKVAGAARSGWLRAKPRARRAGLALADGLRRLLGTKKGRRLALLAVIAVAVLTGFAVVMQAQSHSASAILSQYQSTYKEYMQASSSADNGDKAGARTHLTAVGSRLRTLQPQRRLLDARLAHAALPKGEPRTLSAFESAVAASLDQLNSLVRADPTTVAAYAKDTKPDHFEIIGTKGYLISNGDHPSIWIVGTASGSMTQSKAVLGGYGKIIATTLTSTADGILILTDKPDVLLYRPDIDSITEQKVSYGGWPKSVAIAAYASNLYLLGTDGGVYKHSKNATGYSPKIAYSQAMPGSTSLAVDGSVYLTDASSLVQIFAGTTKQTLTLPSDLAPITNVRSSSDDTTLTGTAKNGHVTVWSLGDKISFQMQIAVKGSGSLADAIYDSASKTYYALAPDRLIRFTATP